MDALHPLSLASRMNRVYLNQRMDGNVGDNVDRSFNGQDPLQAPNSLQDQTRSQKPGITSSKLSGPTRGYGYGSATDSVNLLLPAHSLAPFSKEDRDLNSLRDGRFGGFDFDGGGELNGDQLISGFKTPSARNASIGSWRCASPKCSAQNLWRVVQCAFCGSPRAHGISSNPSTPPRSASSSSTSLSLESPPSSLSSFGSSNLDGKKPLPSSVNSVGAQKINNGFQLHNPLSAAVPSTTRFNSSFANGRPSLIPQDSLGSTTVYATPIPTPTVAQNKNMARTMPFGNGFGSEDAVIYKSVTSHPSLRMDPASFKLNQANSNGFNTAVLNPAPSSAQSNPFSLRNPISPVCPPSLTSQSFGKPFFSTQTPHIPPPSNLPLPDGLSAYGLPTSWGLTPSGRAVAQGGFIQNVSGDDRNPIMMFWPSNEEPPLTCQVRPPISRGSLNGLAPPPILNTGNHGPMTRQALDWECGVCHYVNWRRRKVCQNCFPYALGNEPPASTADKMKVVSVGPVEEQSRAVEPLPPRMDQSHTGWTVQAQAGLNAYHEALTPTHATASTHPTSSQAPGSSSIFGAGNASLFGSNLSGLNSSSAPIGLGGERHADSVTSLGSRLQQQQQLYSTSTSPYLSGTRSLGVGNSFSNRVPGVGGIANQIQAPSPTPAPKLPPYDLSGLLATSNLQRLLEPRPSIDSTFSTSSYSSSSASAPSFTTSTRFGSKTTNHGSSHGDAEMQQLARLLSSSSFTSKGSSSNVSSARPSPRPEQELSRFGSWTDVLGTGLGGVGAATGMHDSTPKENDRWFANVRYRDHGSLLASSN